MIIVSALLFVVSRHEPFARFQDKTMIDRHPRISVLQVDALSLIHIPRVLDKAGYDCMQTQGLTFDLIVVESPRGHVPSGEEVVRYLDKQAPPAMYSIEIGYRGRILRTFSKGGDVLGIHYSLLRPVEGHVSDAVMHVIRKGLAKVGKRFSALRFRHRRIASLHGARPLDGLDIIGKGRHEWVLIQILDGSLEEAETFPAR